MAAQYSIWHELHQKCLSVAQVEAELTPETSSRVAVQFKEFKILGLLSIQAPPSARGKLDTTYLDEDLRISRGDKGNLFILERAGSVE